MITDEECIKIREQLEERGYCPLGAACFNEEQLSPVGNPTWEYAQRRLDISGDILQDIVKDWDYKYYSNGKIQVFHPYRMSSIRVAVAAGLLNKIREAIKKIKPLTLGEIYNS